MRVLTLMLMLVITLTACGKNTKESLYTEGVQQLANNPAGAIIYFKNALEKDGNYNDARFQLAKAYAALGKLEQAEKELIKVLKQNPSRDEALLELAKVLTGSDRGGEAVELVEKYLSRHPDDAGGLEVLGMCYAAQKKYDLAEGYLVQAIKAAPQKPEPHIELASVLIAGGKRDQGKRKIDELLQREPKNLRALYLLAALEKDANGADKASAIYRRILDAHPGEVQAKYKLGLILIEKKDLGQADRAADELVTDHPKKGDGLRLKGLVSYHRKDYAAAITSLQAANKISPSLEAFHYLGLSFYGKGDLETALSQFRVILDRLPRSRQARLMVGQILLTQKRTDDAIAEIKKVIAANDEDAVAHNLLGTAYMAQGLFDEGMRELNRATKLDPNMVNAHLKKGYYYFSKGKNADGELELTTAVQAAPDFQNSRLLLASYYHGQGKPAKAMTVLQSGLTGGGADATLYNAIASLQFASGKKAEGMKTLERAKQINPSLPASYENLAAFYAASGDYQKAMAELGALLKVQPRSLKGLLGLAALNEMVGKESEALGYYQKATETKLQDAYLALAGYHQKKGAPDKAIDVLDQAIKLDPRAIAPLEAKSRVLLAQKEYKKALKVLDEVEVLNQEKGVALKIGAYVEMKDAPRAIEQAGRLVAKRPGSTQGYLLLASVYRGLNDLSSALDEANKAVKADPKSVDARILLGNLLQARKEYDRAMAVYQEALKLKPDSLQAQFSIAALYDATGRKQEAAAKYRAVVDQSNSFVPALNNLAYLCADGYGNKEEALRLAITAFKLQPADPGVMDTVGYALVKNGRAADAVKVMERAAALLPNNPTVRYHLALAYHLAGDKAKSQQALQKCLALGNCPDTRAAQTLLAQLQKK